MSAWWVALIWAMCGAFWIAWMVVRLIERKASSAPAKAARGRSQRVALARELRGESFEAVMSWDRFYRAAEAFLAAYSAPETPGWRLELRAAWETAIRAASLLTRDTQERARALTVLLPLGALTTSEEEPREAYGFEAQALRDFLFAGWMFYQKLKEDTSPDRI